MSADIVVTDDEMAAFDDLGREGTWEIDGRPVSLTNLDKVLFPGRDGEDPITKRELIRYQVEVAPVALPYYEDRPVNLNRFPDGAGSKGFWNKEVPSHAPEWLTRWQHPDADADEVQQYLVIDHVAALVWTAQQGALELHPWTSTAERHKEPTWAMFDIDPGTKTTFEDALLLARMHRTALEHLGVEGCPKVTGQRGIQIWVPVESGHDFSYTATFVEAVSKMIGASVPDMVSWAWRVDERGGRARLDHTQNAINKTLVGPYSPRPRAGAPVSVPIEWDELDDPDLSPGRWTIRTVGERLAERGDPLANVRGLQQELPSF